VWIGENVVKKEEEEVRSISDKPSTITPSTRACWIMQRKTHTERVEVCQDPTGDTGIWSDDVGCRCL
jgi:hypothetical protein